MNERIYIADDEAAICELMRNFLDSAGYRTTCFHDGLSVLKAAERDAPDLVILDIMMPGLSGLDVCAALRKKSAVPIIMVSAKDTPLDRIEGITLGGDDYLVKPFLPLELVARVRALFRRIELIRGAQGPENLLTFGDLRLHTGLRTAEANGKPFALTPTEFDFLAYMVRHSDQATGREELLRKLWQFEDDVPNTRATDDLVKRLRKKLAAQGSRVRVEAVWGYGFRLSLEGGEQGENHRP